MADVLNPKLLERARSLGNLQPLNDLKPPVSKFIAEATLSPISASSSSSVVTTPKKKPIFVVPPDAKRQVTSRTKALPKSNATLNKFFTAISPSVTKAEFQRYDEISLKSEELLPSKPMIPPPPRVIPVSTLGRPKEAATIDASALLRKYGAAPRKKPGRRKKIANSSDDEGESIEHCDGWNDADDDSDEDEPDEDDLAFNVPDEEEIAEDDDSEKEYERVKRKRPRRDGDLITLDDEFSEEDDEELSSSSGSDSMGSSTEEEMYEAEELRKKLREEDEASVFDDQEGAYISCMHSAIDSNEIKEELRIRRYFKLVDCYVDATFFNMFMAILDSMLYHRSFDRNTTPYLEASKFATELIDSDLPWMAGMVTPNACYLWMITKRKLVDLLSITYATEVELIKWFSLILHHETLSDVPIYTHDDIEEHMCFRTGALTRTGVSFTDVKTQKVLHTIWYDLENKEVAWWLNTLVRFVSLPTALYEWCERKRKKNGKVTTHEQRVHILKYAQQSTKIFVEFLKDESICRSDEGYLQKKK